MLRVCKHWMRYKNSRSGFSLSWNADFSHWGFNIFDFQRFSETWSYWLVHKKGEILLLVWSGFKKDDDSISLKGQSRTNVMIVNMNKLEFIWQMSAEKSDEKKISQGYACLLTSILFLRGENDARLLKQRGDKEEDCWHLFKDPRGSSSMSTLWS